MVENKILTSPQGNISTKHISIKESIEKIKESQQQGNIEDLPREGFSIEHVKMFWKQYAYVVKENGLETFYNALAENLFMDVYKQVDDAAKNEPSVNKTEGDFNSLVFFIYINPLVKC